MGAEIDRLEVVIEAEASRATRQLDSLITRLDKVSGSLGKINVGNLTGFANGIEKISRASAGLAGIKTSDFTRLANNLNKISSINTSALNTASSALGMMARQISTLSTASENVAQIGELAKNLSKLGGKGVTNAIENMPKLALSLKEMMATLSTAPAVSRNLISMTNALANLSNSLKGVSASVSKPESSSNKLSGVFSSLSSQVNKSSKSYKNFSQIMGNSYAKIYVAIRGIKKAWKAVESSMDYVETFNYWNVALDKIGKEFGDQFKQYGRESAESYADSFSERLKNITKKMSGYEIGKSGDLTLTSEKNLGLDPEQLMNYQAKIVSVTNAVGLCGETSTNTAEALSMLAADMSSYTNKDLSQVMTNFQSGLIGQSRALYQYGIDITNATLQQYAYDLGLSKSVRAMSQAEKMQLRMIAILDQSKVAWGDQANTLSSVANQYRILKQQISNLARTLGNLFLPIIKTVLPVINGLVIAINRLFTILGFNIHGNNWLKDLQDGTSKGFGNTGLDEVGESADDTSDALDDANKSAKELKGSLAGFDKLNVISNPSDGSGSGSNSESSAGAVDLSGAISDALADYQSVWDKAFGDAENKAQGYADAICEMFDKMLTAIEPFREAISRLWNEGLLMLTRYSFEALKDFYNEFLKPLGEWAFGTPEAGLTRLVNVINNSLMAIDWLWITENLKNFWIAIEPYAEQFGEGLIDFFEDISGLATDAINKLFGQGGALEKMTEWLNNGDPEKARSWGYALGVFAVGLLAFKGIAAILTTIAGVFGTGGLFATIGNGFANIGTVIAGISAPIAIAAAALVTLAAGLSYVFKTNEEVRASFNKAISTIKDNLQPAFEFLCGTVIPDLKKAWDGLLKILRPLGDFLEDVFTSIWLDMINPALSYIGETVLPKLIETFENLWNNVLVPLGGFLADVLGPVFEILADVLGGLWKNIIVPLTEFIGTQLAGAFDLVTTVINEYFIPKINMIITVFQFLWHNVLEPVLDFLWDIWKPVFESICESIGNIIDGLKETFSGLIDFITGIFSGDWERAWNGIKEIFSGIWSTLSSVLAIPLNAVMSLFEGLANKIIDAWNWIKAGINSLSFDMPSWLPDWLGGGKHFGFNFQMSEHINIPRFENGGFPETGELFMARENGITEMVGSMGRKAAVANNSQIVDGIADGVYPAVYNAVMDAFSSNGSRNEGDVVVQIDGREVFRSTRKEAQNYFNMNGCSPFPV